MGPRDNRVHLDGREEVEADVDDERQVHVAVDVEERAEVAAAGGAGEEGHLVRRHSGRVQQQYEDILVPPSHELFAERGATPGR